MSSTKGIRAGRAFVELFADDSKLVRGLRAASAKLKAFGASVGTAGMTMLRYGAAMAAPMGITTKVFADMGDQIAKMSARTGIGVEALSELVYVAELGGTSAEAFENGIRKMQRTLVNAGQGSQSAVENLQMLGLTIEDLSDLSPEGQFKLIADRLSKIEDPTIRAATAMEIFGRAGTELLPMITGGAAEIEELQAQARRLGLTMSSKDAKAAEVFADTMETLWKVLKMAVFTIGAELAPAVQDAAAWLTQFLNPAREWIRQNREIIVTVFRVAMGILTAGVGLKVLGFAIGKLGSVFGVLASAIPLIGTLLSGLGAAIGLLLTPLGAVIGAVVALAGYFLYSSGAMGEAVDWLGGVFNGLRDDAVQAFGGISDALASGDFALAARILWTTLKIWWTKGTNWISSIWNDCMGWLTARWYEAIGGFKIIFESIAHGLMVAWIWVTNGLQQTWAQFVYGIQVAWNWCGKMLKKAWNKIKGVFDKDFDADAANKAVEEAYQSRVTELKNEKDAKLANLDKEYNAQMASENNLYRSNLQRIVDETEAAKAKDQSQRDAKERANDEDLARLQAERNAMVKTAKEQRVQKDLKQDLKKPQFDPKSLVLDSEMDLASLKKSFSVTGTFSGMAAWGMAGGNVQERTAKATEKTAKNTEKLIDIVDGDGATFG